MGLGVFGFPLQEVPFFIIGKEVLTNFCKEIKNFLQQYKSSWPKKKKCVSKGKLINLIKRTWRYYYAVIWRCIQNLMKQNSIKYGQIFNSYYFKKQTHTRVRAHAHTHTHTHIYIYMEQPYRLCHCQTSLSLKALLVKFLNFVL